jgi:RNA polymerase sigma factor (sigma-70 family)
MRANQLEALARAATAGDHAALQSLVTTIAPDVLRVIRTVLGTAHPDVEDLVQDSLLGLVRALPGFRYESSLTTLALTIAFRHALGAKRRQRDVTRWIDTFHRLEEPLVSPPSSPAQTLEIERRRGLVAGLLTTIPKPQAEALGLRVVVGLSIDEIAHATLVPPNTVRSRLRLAKEALRKAIEADPALSEFLEPLR